MSMESVSGLSNVVRFPVEFRARPTVAVLWDLAPDVREVLSLAEAFGLELPVGDLRDRVDAETAEHIANQVAGAGPGREAALADMLDGVLGVALAACWRVRISSTAAFEAERALVGAPAGDSWLVGLLRDRADVAARAMAEAMLEAHVRAEEAAGVSRAVGFARRGEEWSPRSLRADVEWLLGDRRAG